MYLIQLHVNMIHLHCIHVQIAGYSRDKNGTPKGRRLLPQLLLLFEC